MKRMKYSGTRPQPVPEKSGNIRPLLLAASAVTAFCLVLVIACRSPAPPARTEQQTVTEKTEMPAPADPRPALNTAVQQSLALPTWRISAPGKPAPGKPWTTVYDDSTWAERRLPWDWTRKTLSNNPKQKPANYADASNWGGMRTGLRSLWFRVPFDLPENLRDQELILDLGGIGDRDITFVNGREVGRTNNPFVSRAYRLPKDLLKPTGNVIAVYVRHDAPPVQLAHYHRYWGHSELGWFWPGGIYEQAPRLRPVSKLDPKVPDFVGMPTVADVTLPHLKKRKKNAKPAPPADLTVELTTATGRFFNADERQLKINAAVKHSSGQQPDTLRLEVLDVGGQVLSTTDKRVAFAADGTARTSFAVTLPDRGWYRLQTKPMLSGKHLELKLGGQHEINYAVLPAHPMERRPDSVFGICQPAAVPEDAFRAMQAIGARWLRWDVVWDHFEPAKGKYNFDHKQVGGVVKLCRKYEIEMMPDFTYCARWAVHPDAKKTKRYWIFSPPAKEEDYRRAVRDFATHFKNDIRVYELWNEPMLNHFLIPVEGMNNEKTYWTKIFKPAAEELRKVDPKIKILYASQWAEPFGAARKNRQLTGLFDGAAIHPYSADEPEIGRFGGISTYTVNMAGRKGSGWKKAGDFSCMQPATTKALEVWNTETGWFPSGVKGELAALSSRFNRRHVASWIPRAYVTSVFRGIKKYFYFALGEHVFTPDFKQPLPAALAYSTTAHFLDGTLPVAMVKLRHGLPVYIFQSKTDRTKFVAVLWSRGQDFFLKLPEGIPAHDIQARQQRPNSGYITITPEASFLTINEASGDTGTVVSRCAKLATHATGTGGGLDLWRKSGEAKPWAKRIAEALTDEPKTERNRKP